MLLDTRVLVPATPGCQHRQDGGVKQGEIGIPATKSLYSGEIKSLFWDKKVVD